MRENAGKLRTIALLSLFILSVLSIAAEACQFDMCTSTTYGRVNSSALTITREIHQYTFSATEGDRIIIRMNRASGTLEPRIELYDLSGNLLVQAGTGSAWAQITDLYIHNSGSYEFRCMDGSGPGRGDYTVSVQNTSQPGGAVVLEYDDVVQDSIREYSEMKAYQFFAYINESVKLQVISIDGTIDPRIELFDPNGSRIGTETGTVEVNLVENALGMTGMYTVLISDNFASEIGGFYFVLNRIPTDVDDDPSGLPSELSLGQNYPNPFNPSTRIDYTLQKSSYVTIDVFNVIGEKVTRLMGGMVLAGEHTISWYGKDADGEEVTSGIYYYRLTSDDFTETRKMVLLK